jgi:tRNA A58 N-methylase Trm61
VTIIQGDLMEVDVSEASVVMLYLVPKGMQRVAEKLKKELKPGARVVCYLFR